VKILEKPNLENDWKCPVCGTFEEKPVGLIPVSEIENLSGLQPVQIHVECINLKFVKSERRVILFMGYEHGEAV